MNYKKAHQTVLLLAWLTGFLNAACIGRDLSGGNTPHADFAIRDIWTSDHRNQGWPLEATPLWPKLHIDASEDIDAEWPAVTLIHGSIDVSSDARFNRETPLPSALKENAVSSKVLVEGSSLVVVPDAALERGNTYTLIVAAWLRSQSKHSLSQSRSSVFRVSESLDAGAKIANVFPVENAVRIGTNLSELLLLFDGHVAVETANVTLSDASGGQILGSPTIIDCRDISWQRGTCVRFVPEQSLIAQSRYRVTLADTFVDLTGASQAYQFDFSTDDGADETSPTLASMPCARDERTTALGCVVAYDDALEVRFVPSESAFVTLATDATTIGWIYAQGVAERLVEVVPLHENTLQMTLKDASGNRFERSAEITPSSGLAMLTVSEVNLNPEGAEAMGEYVELWNFGTQEINLKGFSLSDDPAKPGDTIAEDFLIQSNERVVLGGQDFVPTSLAPNVRWLKLVGTLGYNGLANEGETLVLRDAQGRRVSSTPKLIAREEGLCAQRVSTHPRSGVSGSFRTIACNPGL